MTLLTQFQSAQPILVALGDPSRQAIISAMLENGCDTGMRVGDLTKPSPYHALPSPIT
ncbi:hypothetical protein [Lacticaseibacillus manihotivorans]|uniref:hypothetical protein n=1 Tax=Lacticaseibacillus manihotivorans TaxID=88233 RepID=UPI000B2A931C